MKPISTCLWFDTEAEQAAKFYTKIFTKGKIHKVEHYGPNAPRPEGSVMTVTFSLNGQQYLALNGGPDPKPNHAVSFMVFCKDQKEIDHYWKKLTAGGGKPVACGWLTDKYGFSWQIIPEVWMKLMATKDREKKSRMLQALWSMTKLDIKKLQAAYDGKVQSFKKR
jgi:predicted 3-demethylubiquinone-9 3-methyltransferase (glyoxalase superfamily)